MLNMIAEDFRLINEHYNTRNGRLKALLCSTVTRCVRKSLWRWLNRGRQTTKQARKEKQNRHKWISIDTSDTQINAFAIECSYHCQLINGNFSVILFFFSQKHVKQFIFLSKLTIKIVVSTEWAQLFIICGAQIVRKWIICKWTDEWSFSGIIIIVYYPELIRT